MTIGKGAAARPAAKTARSLSSNDDGAAEEEQEADDTQMLPTAGVHAPRKRAADTVAELKHQLQVYNDWILPGAVRTPIPKRSFEDNRGFDKRVVLADDQYWAD